jgi:riboflavin synthase
MFTGIIENKGKVFRVEFRGQEKRLFLELPFDLTEVQVGDSINLNGACLTVVEKKGKLIGVDLSLETLQRTTLSKVKEGEYVNVERALRLSDRLGGHIVTGHIDGIGLITERRKERDFLFIRIQIPETVSKYIVQKGSVAIDGISLTVNEYRGEGIFLTLIPYTLEKTTLIEKKVGDEVNVEADILGKYVEKMLTQGGKKSEGVNLSFLKEHGFIKDE